MCRDKWSPELISKKWKQHNIPIVSHETIYKWISKHTKENQDYKGLYKELKHGKRRQKRENIKDTRGAIVTLNDRASGMLWMRKVETRDAKSVRVKLAEMLEENSPYIKSVTGDNEKEFSEHQHITNDFFDFYFANPYSSWGRGANENLNGLVIQYIPKKADFSLISEQRIKEIEEKLNSRPRKRFIYENPTF